MILRSVLHALFVDPNSPVTMDASDARLLSAEQRAHVNLDPFPHLFALNQELSFSFAP